MNDTIADMLTRIRNASHAKKETVSMASSKMKEAISEILKSEGYINGFNINEDNKKKTLEVALKYYKGQNTFDEIKRVSKGSCRIYVGKTEIPRVKGGLGTAVLSTSKGVMTDKKARSLNIGGELLFTIS